MKMLNSERSDIDPPNRILRQQQGPAGNRAVAPEVI
jgi:hypothetical protein